MSDDKSKTGTDRKRINVNENYELRDWANKLGVTTDELVVAVSEVGDSADAVRAHVKQKK